MATGALSHPSGRALLRRSVPVLADVPKYTVNGLLPRARPMRCGRMLALTLLRRMPSSLACCGSPRRSRRPSNRLRLATTDTATPEAASTSSFCRGPAL